MIKKIKNVISVITAICVLQISFSQSAFADSSIPRGGAVSTKDLSFVDKTIEVITELLFVKLRFLIATATLFAAIITIKSIAVAIPLFLMSLLLMFFPAINAGFWKLGSLKGILKE